MRPGQNDGDRRMSWEPSAQLGVRVALVMAAMSVVVGLGAAALGTSGVDSWLRAMDVLLLALATLGAVVAWARSQVEVRRHWWWVSAALAGFAFSELMLSLGVSPWLEQRWPTPADVGVLVFLGCMIAFLIRHLQAGDTATVVVHLLDAALMALAVTFLLWELVISPGIGDVSDLPLVTQILVVLYPALDVLIASIVLLLLLVDRSTARVWLLVGMVALAVGDTVAGTNVRQVTNSSALASSLGWIIGVVCIVVALAVPAGARLTARRPTLPRLLLVHGLVTAGVWLATWRYVIHDGHANGATAVIGVILGVLWLCRSVTPRSASRESGQNSVHNNLDELRAAELGLRQLLDDLPDAVVVLARDGRIIDLNANTVDAHRPRSR